MDEARLREALQEMWIPMYAGCSQDGMPILRSLLREVVEECEKAAQEQAQRVLDRWSVDGGLDFYGDRREVGRVASVATDDVGVAIRERFAWLEGK